MKKHFLLIFLVLSFTAAKAQDFTLSESAEISILTIGPGKQLYDKFGHSAFRIKDTLNGFDVVFNYGVYDFDTPNFYLKFARGKLLYELGVSYYDPFFESYVRQNRWIKEQALTLNYSEKRALSDFLWNNALPENKKYKYDFFFDNCATKIRDVLMQTLGGKLRYHEDYIAEDYTFRELIRKNLHENSWGSLGIDLALGAVIDRKAKPIEYQFLPDYVHKSAKTATITKNGETKPLVGKETLLFQNKKTEENRSFLLSPFFVFGLLGLLIVYITFRDFKRKHRSRILDFLIFFVSGAVGLLLVLLWFATDHTATAANLNLLWAFPLSLFLSFAVFRKNPKPWLLNYCRFLLLLQLSVFVLWLFGVQRFPIGFLPLFIALALRYSFLGFLYKNK